jgi:hypothetical protein
MEKLFHVFDNGLKKCVNNNKKKVNKIFSIPKATWNGTKHIDAYKIPINKPLLILSFPAAMAIKKIIPNKAQTLRAFKKYC